MPYATGDRLTGWDAIQYGDVPLRLDQRAYGPIWGRLSLVSGYAELLYQPRPPSGPYREYRFFLHGHTNESRCVGAPSSIAAVPPPPPPPSLNRSELWITDKYHTRIASDDSLVSDPMTSTMEGTDTIPVSAILEACCAALVNANSPSSAGAVRGTCRTHRS